jgi:hypothetical protein
MKGFQFAAYLVILSTADPTIFVLGAKAQEPCKLADIGQGTVASVRDGRTLLLADGRPSAYAARSRPGPLWASGRVRSCR